MLTSSLSLSTRLFGICSCFIISSSKQSFRLPCWWYRRRRFKGGWLIILAGGAQALHKLHQIIRWDTEICLSIRVSDFGSSLGVRPYRVFCRTLTAIIMRHPPQRGGFYSSWKHLSCIIYLKDRYKARIFQALKANSIQLQNNQILQYGTSTCVDWPRQYGQGKYAKPSASPALR